MKTEIYPVPLADVKRLEAILRQELQIDPAVVIEPGTYIGHAHLELKTTRVGDFNWPFQGTFVTEKVIEMFEEHKISGYKIHPIYIDKVVQRKKDPPLPNICEIEVTGKAGEPDADKSNYHLTMSCDFCGRKEFTDWEGLYLNEKTWDGADIFQFDSLPGRFFVTERLEQILAGAKLKNFVLTPSEELMRNPYKRSS